jgi:hypothetical protein
MASDYSWALTEQIDVTQIADDIYLIERINLPSALTLTVARNAEPGQSLLFNGRFVDVGDDFISYISIIDDYHEQGNGEIGKTVRQEPFEEQ